MSPTTTHLAAGAGGVVGGVNVYGALVTLMTGWHGMDAAHADAAASLLVYGATALGAFVVWFIAWRWPNVPPLP
jgi:hypothetical protein